jgi:predicted nicotinamide N-methyase
MAAAYPECDTRSVVGNGALTAVRTSLSEQLAALRGVPVAELPAPLLDVALRKVAGVPVLLPADWEALRHDEGAVGRPVPFWARPWPSGTALARALAGEPPRAGARVLELGCGLGAPSIVAARAGALVLATDGATDAVAYAAHSLALNQTTGDVAHADWAEHGDELAGRGPFDLVLGADVLYTPANAQLLVRLLPRLLAPWGEVQLADPGRANARVFLAAARASFAVRKREAGDVTLYRLIPR